MESLKLEIKNSGIAASQYVVGVDPAFGGKCEVGIILACSTENSNYIILDDFSGKYSPETWVYMVQTLSMEFSAIISIEINQGGELITSLFRNFPTEPQRAIRNKYERATICYLKYKEGKVQHLKHLERLENQMLNFSQGEKDRVDALVWALLFFINKETNKFDFFSIF